MRRLGLMLACALAFAAGTWGLGWWTLPLIAAACGLRCRVADTVVAATLAWGALLVVQATRAPLGPLLERLGGLFGVPPWALMVLTLAFAGLLAWSAATLMAGFRRGPAPTA
jgi:hypothetical protein